jgi:hypothetical protein
MDRGLAERSVGDAFLTSEQLQRALDRRAITAAQLQRALAVLMGDDPAGVIPVVNYEQVAHVAAYLHSRIGGAWVPNPFWILIERGHRAARAIFWHELQELYGYHLLGEQNPLTVRPGSTFYWQAHAWASWQEAGYWEAWAATDGEDIPAEAFLQSHPLRDDFAELPRLLSELAVVWTIEVRSSPVVALRRARRFYQDKRLAGPEIERWLSP